MINVPEAIVRMAKSMWLETRELVGAEGIEPPSSAM